MHSKPDFILFSINAYEEHKSRAINCLNIILLLHYTNEKICPVRNLMHLEYATLCIQIWEPDLPLNLHFTKTRYVYHFVCTTENQPFAIFSR